MVRYGSGWKYGQCHYNTDDQDRPLNQTGVKHMSDKLVTGTLSDADRQAIQTAVQTALTKFTCGVRLTVEQRSKLPKAADANIGIINDALAVATGAPDILPRNFDEAGFQARVALMNTVLQLVGLEGQLHQMLLDTLMALGSDNYTDSLVVYRAAETSKPAGLEDVLARMEAHFKSHGHVQTAAKTAGKTTPPA